MSNNIKQAIILVTIVAFVSSCIFPAVSPGEEKKIEPGPRSTASAEERAPSTTIAEAKSRIAGEGEVGEDKGKEGEREEGITGEDKGREGEEEVAEEEASPQAAVDPGNITVNFKGADIKTVLAYISEVAGVDIVPSPEVKGIIDLKLTNKPWKVALDIILRNYGFAYEREGDIIRVVTVDKLKQEELVTQTFNLNYGKSKDVVNSIKDIVTDRGKVMYDERTNTVLVTDIPTNIYRVGQIIDRLDKRTDQVLIEARIIETVLDDNEKLGIDWNVKFSASGARRPMTLPFDQITVPFQATKYFPQVQVNTDTTVADTGGGATGSSVVSASSFPTGYGPAQGFPFAGTDQFSFGSLDFTEFKAVLEFIKKRSNTDIISNPRIATLNNTEALINVGETLNLPKYERNSSTGKMEITGYEAKDLGIILKVTPHINDKGEIVVDLYPQISDLLRYDTLDKASGVVAPVWSSRQAKTQIMIKDGDTIFIGGLIKENDIDVKNKLPFLGDMFGDVPYLGLLFTKKEKVKKKTELIFFITVNLMTVGKEIKDMPTANKAYVPMYSLTQTPDPGIKKRIKKRN
ncbi:MAG: secretin N-terminal domain-containing protein [Candidatus Omnitrophota bacterium]